MIQRIRFLNTADNVMYTTSENVARQQNSGLEIVGKNNLFSILSLTTTVNLYYSKLDGFSYLPEGAEAPVTGEEDEELQLERTHDCQCQSSLGCFPTGHRQL
mgnify:CR=1 FL=1